MQLGVGERGEVWGWRRDQWLEQQVLVRSESCPSSQAAESPGQGHWAGSGRLLGRPALQHSPNAQAPQTHLLFSTLLSAKAPPLSCSLNPRDPGWGHGRPDQPRAWNRHGQKLSWHYSDFSQRRLLSSAADMPLA